MTNVEPEGFVYPDPVAVCVDVLSVPEGNEFCVLTPR